ncbi:MAG: MBL fold metallo-hydrolase [Clostridia bacterium]|nr:MBL fold metallo-hydrolase [Clostridia bacterium]
MSERKSNSKAKNTAKKAVKKAYKKNPKAFIIGAIALVLVIAISVAVIYFAFPETWDSIMAMIANNGGDPDDNGGSNGDSLERGDGELQIHFIDVGQGDCILILFPDGKEMLIDSANYNDDGEIEKRTLDYLDTYITDDQIDYLMVTHGDSDHTYFVNEVIEAYDVDTIYMPFILAEPSNEALQAQVNALEKSKLDMFTDKDTISTKVYAEFFISALSEPDATIVLNIGQFSIETATYRFDFYCYAQEDWANTNLNSAEKKNAISPIGILEYNGKRIVLTGDSNEINEPMFIEAVGGTGLDCDVLKVGHHGSETSSTREFLDFINCEYAVISCNAEGNTFLHPRQNTLDRLRADNMTLYRTDLHGTVVLVVDANGTLTFTTEKTTTADVWMGADTAQNQG